MKGNFKRLLRADFKRAVRIIPGIFITALIFACVAGLLLFYSEDLIYSKKSFASVSAGIYMPDDNSYNQLAMNFARNMDSVKETANIVSIYDIEEGKELVKKGEITALIVIPENFIEGLYKGDNPQIEIIFGPNVTLEEHLVNDVIVLASNLLGTAQSSYQAYYRSMEQFISNKESRLKIAAKLDERNLSYVASRMQLFEINTINSASSHNLRETLTASFILIILMLMCFQITSFYKSYNRSFILRQNKEGGSSVKLFLSRAICGSFLLYTVYLFIFLLLAVTKTGPNLLSLITIIPVVLFSAVFTLTMSMIIRSEHLVNGAIFMITILMIYLAGGLIPILLMPKFLQGAEVFNPVTYILKYILWAVY
ncbi:ABC-2 family transporter protein [Eubacterium ruminantium]|nr:ABC-2 family transporter protein [Eubacterium ruminantium]